MTCSTCGQSSYSSHSGGTCDGRKAMDENRPLKQIQNGDTNFCFNEIDDKACSSLGKNQGIHPTATHANNSCDDLKALNDLGIGKLNNKLILLDICNFNDIKCWLFSLLSWIWNINKGIICTICGMWCTINKLKAAVLNMAYDNVDTQGAYIIQEETPELSVTVRKDGTFTYKWSDWDNSTTPWTKLGSGVLTGKLGIKLSTNSEGGLDYEINGVHIDTISYSTTNKFTGTSNPTYYILVPRDGTRVWSRPGNVNTSWSETLNKTFAFNKKGNINPTSESGFIDFMTWGADWAVDDRVQLRFKFINHNQKIDLDC